MNKKNYRYLKKFIRSIKDGILIPDPAKYIVSATNIANKFDSLSDWDEKLRLLELLKDIYYTEFEGVDANSKTALYSDKLKVVLNSGEIDTIKKTINKNRRDLVVLCKEELVISSTLSETIFSHIMKIYPELRIEVFSYNLNNSNNDVVLVWIKSNYNLIKNDVVSYQNIILPKAIPGNVPVKVLCEMLAAMPVKKGSAQNDERESQFEVLFSHNTGSSEAEILNILNGFVWAYLEPTDDQKTRLNKKIRDNGVWTEKKLVNSLKHKYWRIKNS